MRIVRLISIPTDRSVFLWGPRRTGKSFWLREHLAAVPWIALLNTEVFAEYAARPQLLRERASSEVRRHGSQTIVVDEVQKVPALLDEVHWLIENRGLRFVLTGSSARKLRRGHANLLAGRAWRREMRPLCFGELWPAAPPSGWPDFSVERCVLAGMLPAHVLTDHPVEELRAYVADYLREEIASEALVRNLPGFSEFLRVAAITSSELLNYANVARESGVSSKVVRGYFEILEDTLLGFRIPPWTRSAHRRMILTEKFSFFDVGVANYLARRQPNPGTPKYGKSFEQLVLMELMAYRAYRIPEMEIRFWRTSTGVEVDFLLEDRSVAVEIKSGTRVQDADTRGLRDLADDHPVGRRFLVHGGREPQVLRDRHSDIACLPPRDFVNALWSGNVVG
ncbi:MAG: ATP-binding protein [Verrucomicrobia bacterium]|nr:ATP-binding protein [Verrucomicrobiota bacterium]